MGADGNAFLYSAKLAGYPPRARLYQSTDTSGSPPVAGTKAGVSFEKFFLSSEIVQQSFLDKGLIIYRCDFALNFYAGSANMGIFNQILLPRQLKQHPNNCAWVRFIINYGLNFQLVESLTNVICWLAFPLYL